MRTKVTLLLLVAMLALASGCTAPQPASPAPVSGAPEPGTPIPPAGDLLASTDGSYRVYGQIDVAQAAGLAASTAPDRAAPQGVEVLGSGVAVRVNRALAQPVEIRLALPPQPNDAAVPGVLHVADDGTLSVEPATWDAASNEVIVAADTFSDRYPAWFDPDAWWNGVKGVFTGVGDFLAAFFAGRTSPPKCGTRPQWAHYQTVELSSVHVCLQTTRDQKDGTEQADYLIKSNRSTFQLITIPSTTKAYTWYENEGFWRIPIAQALGANPDTEAVLPGGSSLSFGFKQPDRSTDGEIRSYMTYPMIFINPVDALLGGLIGLRDKPGDEVLAMIYTTMSCVDKVAGTESLKLKLIPTGKRETVEKLKAGVECVFDLLSNPELAYSAINELIDAGKIPRPSPQIMDGLRMKLKGFEDTAKKISGRLAVINATTAAWDSIFDSLAEGSLEFQLDGKANPVSSYPAGQWSGRSRTVQLAPDGTGSAMYLVHGPTGGCTSGSRSKDPCYFNVQFKLNGGSDPNFTGKITGTYFSEGSTRVPSSEYGTNLPAVGAAMSIRIDHAKDMAFYQDTHGTTDVCGPNPTAPRQGCS